jgi:LDH2 family malate/lactate/ureidoglycolate dehydrogenase
LPFGGYKGSGLALVTDLLGGILTGNGPGKNWWEKGGHSVNGVFLQALAVEEFQPLDTFYDSLDEFIAFVKQTKCAPGFSEILLPGESARLREGLNIKHGVEIDEETWSDLADLAAELGVKEVPTAV